MFLILMMLAVAVRKRTGAKWTLEESLEMASKERQVQERERCWGCEVTVMFMPQKINRTLTAVIFDSSAIFDVSGLMSA